LDLFQHISKWHEISPTNVTFYGLYDLKAENPKTLKQKRYDQKTKFDTKSSKAHNIHKTQPFSSGILKIEASYSFI